MRKIFSIAIAAAAVAVSAAPASAAPIVVNGVVVDRVSMTVDIRGLDASAVERRIAFAARRVCGMPENRAIDESQRVVACRTAAIDGARKQIAGVAGVTSVALAAIY
jgi:UrcA family protein